MTWVKAMIKDYRKSRSMMIKYRDSLKRPDHEEQTLEEMDQLSVVNDAVSSLSYTIDWLSTGRQPYKRRGIDRHDAYRRAVLMDMDLLPNTPPEQELRITEAQRQAVVDILMAMSARELECYVMHMSNGLSLAEIARELKLSKRTVQQSVDRAKAKVAQGISDFMTYG